MANESVVDLCKAIEPGRYQEEDFGLCVGCSEDFPVEGS